MRISLTKQKKVQSNLLDHKWEMRFYELRKFKKKFGHCNVSHSTKNKKYLPLAKWCQHQRGLKKFNSLRYSPDRIDKLNSIGFCWNILDKLFEKKFNQLAEYHKKYGHCNISYAENEELAKWCSKLREERKLNISRLTKERIKRLNKLSFSWHDQQKEQNDLSWRRQFALLKTYRKKYGHCNVSFSRHNLNELNLADWVHTQRQYYRDKNKVLTTERIAKLNSIGFNWTNPIKAGDAQKISDTDLLKELQILYAKYGTPPTFSIIEKYSKYSSGVYYKRFGGPLKACKAAGIKPEKRKTTGAKKEKTQ